MNTTPPVDNFYKKHKKIIKLVIFLLVLFEFLRSCGPTLFKTVNLISEASKIAPFQDEMNILFDLNITKDDFNRPIVSTDENYKAIEEAIKKYLNDASSLVKEINNKIENGAYKTIFEFNSYDDDYLIDASETIDLTENTLISSLDKLKNLGNQEEILSYIKKYNLNDEGESLYLDGINTYNQDKLKDVITSLEKKVNETIDKLEIEKSMILYLMTNQDKWIVENNTIVFNDITTEEEYYNLKKTLE